MTETELPPIQTTSSNSLPLTSYVILRKTESGLWAPNGDPIQARSAEAAIRSIYGKDETATVPSETEVYVAVPERSWKPVTVTAQQTTTLRLDTA